MHGILHRRGNFGYTDAIRQRVLVPSDFDSDGDGVNDVIAMDIMRPAASDQGMKVPVIMDASPYHSTLGRGNESQLKVDGRGDGDRLAQRPPARLRPEQRPRDRRELARRAHGHDRQVLRRPAGRRGGDDRRGRADHRGHRVRPLPVLRLHALQRRHPARQPLSRGLAGTVTNPDRRDHCAAVRADLNANDGDATANYSPFWEPRNYVKDAFKVRASVLATHGLQDENVRPDHFSKWWYALSEDGAPRHARLMQVGHVDPFDVNRADSVDELHRWFDYWLWQVPNDVMADPPVEVETSPGTFTKYASWPASGSAQTQVFLQPGSALGLAPAAGAEQTTTFTDSQRQRETAMLADPATVNDGRRVFLSPPLSRAVHVSGTPVVQLNASIDNKTGAHLGAILVDYGPAFPRVVDNSDNNGVQTLTTTDCWGESSPADSACCKDVGELVDTSSTAWRVSKGVLDAGHKDSLTEPAPIVAGQRHPFSFPLLPADYTFPAGHRIGVVIVGSYRDYGTSSDTATAASTRPPVPPCRTSSIRSSPSPGRCRPRSR